LEVKPGKYSRTFSAQFKKPSRVRLTELRRFKMRSLVDVLLGIVGVAALVFAIWQFYLFAATTDPQGNTPHLWKAIAGFVVLCVCALAIFLRHSGAEEEIHITQ
jgi:uncharacterized membrane protein